MKKILVLFVVLAALLVIPATAKADTSFCPDGYACFWSKADFDGVRVKVDPITSQTGTDLGLQPYDRSAKNRLYNNRRVAFKDTLHDRVACLEPGQNENNLPASTLYYNMGAQATFC